MKAKRRKELRHHDLADGLEQAVRWAKEHANAVLLVVVILVAVLLGASYMISGRRSAADRAWGQLVRASAMSASGLDRVAALEQVTASTSDRTVAALALTRSGDELYQQQRQSSPGRLEQISATRACYLQVVDEYSDQVLAAARARFGLAALAEEQRQFEEARSHYEAITKLSGLEGSVFVTMANFRARLLAELEREQISFPDQATTPDADAEAAGEGEPAKTLQTETTEPGS